MDNIVTLWLCPHSFWWFYFSGQAKMVWKQMHYLCFSSLLTMQPQWESKLMTFYIRSWIQMKASWWSILHFLTLKARNIVFLPLLQLLAFLIFSAAEKVSHLLKNEQPPQSTKDYLCLAKIKIILKQALYENANIIVFLLLKKSYWNCLN